jgi:hypothetical protein
LRDFRILSYKGMGPGEYFVLIHRNSVAVLTVRALR